MIWYPCGRFTSAKVTLEDIAKARGEALQTVGAMEKNPNVKYVATDDIRYAIAQVVPTGIRRIFAHSNGNIGIWNTKLHKLPDQGVLYGCVCSHAIDYNNLSFARNDRFDSTMRYDSVGNGE